MKKLVSIIIPTYNRKEEIVECLNSVYNLNYANFEVIVVDNGSEDGTIDVLKNNYPSAKLIELKENLGAVGGRNIGIKIAKGDYLLFVDSDNLIDANALKELVNFAETDEMIGFIGPKMYYYSDSNRIWYAGVKISLLTSKTRYIGINEIDRGQYDQIREVEHIPNVWLVKREVIKKIGGLDPVYVMTYGEADWPMRAKKEGFKIMFCPKAKVWHKIPLPKDQKGLRARIGFDNSFRVYYIARNRTLFMKRFAPRINFVVYVLFLMHFFIMYYLIVLIRFGRFDLIIPLMKGSVDGVKVSVSGKI
ncbi:MAG: glycosyltransferase family 2 protein [Halobacteriota archaeon]|nr:glycosyltransferase family 2 protein [Halobacteriota archaeon]